MKSSEKSRYPFALLVPYLFFYAAQAVYTTYFNLYLDEKGFTSTQMGLIASISTLPVFLVQPLMGLASDRAKKKNHVVSLLLAGSLAVALCFRAQISFPFVLLMACLFASLNTPATPLIDNITLESLERRQGKAVSFGHIRIGGTLGYCAAVLTAGLLFHEQYERMFPALSGLLLCTLLAFQLIPAIPGGGRKSEPKREALRAVLQDRGILRLTALYALFSLTSYNFHAFYPIYYKSIGATSSMVGLMMFVAALSEIPLWFAAQPLFSRFGVSAVAGAASLITAFRWLLLYLYPSVAGAVAINLLHGIGFVFLSYGLVTTVNERLPAAYRATGQSVVSMFATFVSRIVGGVLCGWLSDRIGGRMMMLLNFVATLLLLAALTLRLRRKPADEACSLRM
ncbi:MAG: MFS transporter [Clostridia bacterium]|nr:MFS transporter [Clostridia bacterium]